MKNRWYIVYVFCSLLFVVDVFAQPRSFGMVLDDETYSQADRLSSNFSGKKFNKLPLKVDLSPYAPSSASQGNISSCVGWAVGYGAMTILKAVKEGETEQAEIDKMAHSALFIYNQVKKGACGEGASVSEALKFALGSGNCFSAEFDHPINDCERKPTEKTKVKAAQNKIKDYLTLFDIEADVDVKILAARRSLANDKPVIIGMEMTPNFFDIGSGSNAIWKPEGKIKLGGHSMVLVGYSDALQSFRILNSWGPEFGDKGYFWMGYDDFGKQCRYGYQMTLDQLLAGGVKSDQTGVDGIGIALKGDFIFRFPIGVDDEDNVFFEHATPIWNGEYFELTRKDWQTGNVFQLVSQKMQEDSYTYVFSVDANDKVQIHFPPSERLDTIIPGPREIPLIQNEEIDIVVPGELEALVLETVGKDYLIVLYSDRKIDNLKDKVKQVGKEEGTAMARIKSVFGESLISPEKIIYKVDQDAQGNPVMSFQTPSRKGSIVPLVLEVNVSE